VPEQVILYGGSDARVTAEVKRQLAGGAFEVVLCSRWEEACRAAPHAKLAILVASPRCGYDPFSGARAIQGARNRPSLILVVSAGSKDMAGQAARAGFAGYLRQPFHAGEVLACLERCRGDDVGEPVLAGSERLIGSSAAMREVRAQIRDISESNCNVLVTGETGTGKKLVAELVHCNSARRTRPLVSVNCAAIPDGLWESELFGYEPGAFTGAHARKEGKLELANGGTIFFDEIGEMTLFAQAKILRAIETRQIARLGGKHSVPLDIRIVVASNRNLDELVDSGQFRKDLFFRLNVARVDLPPLRRRREDIPELLAHYLREFNARAGRSIEGCTAETESQLLSYEWPGNVRELRNVLEASFVHMPFAQMRFLELPDQYRERLRNPGEQPSKEERELRSTLAAVNWNRSRAAQELRWSRMTLYRKIAKYKLVKPVLPKA
jgi:DNA-binding NtrC family response regulator